RPRRSPRDGISGRGQPRGELSSGRSDPSVGQVEPDVWRTNLWRVSRSAVGVGRPVPFLNLRPMHDEIAEAALADVATLIETGAFTNGPAVAEFEQAFASYCGVEHCVGLASGLDALRLGLIAGGLEPGDCV